MIGMRIPMVPKDDPVEKLITAANKKDRLGRIQVGTSVLSNEDR